MPAIAGASVLRKVLDDQFSILAAELVAVLEQEVALHENELRHTVREEVAEILNQSVRMLRQADDFSQMCSVLVDSSATYCKLLAVFSIDGEKLRGERVRGLEPDAADPFTRLELSLADAPAFAGAVESGDPVVTMTTAREISPVLAELFGHSPDERAYILPVLAHGRAVGLIYASGGVEMALLEMLAQAVGLAAEVRYPPEPPRKAELVVIQPAKPVERKPPASWAELSPEEQEIHLRAQRFARVQVAGMHLFSPDLVKRGRLAKDLYGALQKDIDSGRDLFRQSFLEKTPTMLDYFHLELVRTLANDDPKLLGDTYPGPMV